jgi:hypothetical protein
VLLLRARPDLRPRLGLIPPVVLAAGIALAVPLLLGVPSLPATLLGSVLFFAVLALLRQIPPELFEALRLQRSARA